jgi:excinuclease UvrABC nuclease subunit
MLNEIKSHYYTWSKSWIEFKAPNAQGVYSIRDKEGKVIFIGKGNIRQRLLSHWNRENSTDAVVWNYNPCSFRFELTDHPADREAELIRELKPTCRQMSQSKFPKFW